MKSFAVSGSRIILSELLLDLAARLSTSLLVIDSAGIFDPLRFKQLGGSMRKVRVTRPHSASQLRSLIDSRLETMMKKTRATTIIIPSTYGLFCKIRSHDLPYVCEYVIDVLFELCQRYDVTLIVGCDGRGYVDRQFSQRSDFSLNLDDLKRSQVDMF